MTNAQCSEHLLCTIELSADDDAFLLGQATELPKVIGLLFLHPVEVKLAGCLV